MKWERLKLGDICTLVTSGGTPLSKEASYYEPKEIPWLKTKEVNYCRIYDTENYISREGLANSSAKIIPENSIIVAMYGQGDTAGRVAINKIPLCTNQACCNLVINPEIADYEFVYYYLCTLYDKLVALKNGGAQPNLNANKIKAIEIPLPEITVQHKISSILSVYDDLIENNQKQIKLLEEAAQRLYKEWFVDLRFPGHETAKIVDGVPEGWNATGIDEVFWIKYGKTLSTSNISTTGKYPVYGANGIIGFYCEKNCDDFVTLITSRGNGSGEVHRTYDKESFITNNSFIIKPKDEELGFPFVYQFMLNTDFKTICTGSAQPQLTNSSISALQIVVPMKSLVLKFNVFAQEINDRIIKLISQNRLLAEARDRLLPKLMSGELEV